MSSCVKSLYNRLGSFGSLLISRPCVISFKGDYYTSSVYSNHQNVKIDKRRQGNDYSIIVFHPNKLEYLQPELYRKYPKHNSVHTSYDLLNPRCLSFADHEKPVVILNNSVKIVAKLKSKSVLSFADDRLKESETPPNEVNPSPSTENLDNIFICLSNELEAFFSRMHPFRIYNDNIIFENNIRGTRTVGVTRYALQVIMAKLLAHVRFAYVGLTILKITKHPQDNTVRVRWRVQGIGGTRVILTFWRYKIWKLNTTIEQAPTWVDGFSVFHVGSDGKIYKHVLDKVQPDDDPVVSDKTNVIAKLALILGGLIDTGALYALGRFYKTRRKHLSSDSEITLHSEKVNT